MKKDESAIARRVRGKRDRDSERNFMSIRPSTYLSSTINTDWDEHIEKSNIKLV